MRRGYLIDTNVISELIRDRPNSEVTRWLASAAPDTLYLSVITLGELAHGVSRLSPSARRARLEKWLTTTIEQFAGRLLEFGERHAVCWGRLRADVEKCGRPRSIIDLQIAAVAQVAELVVVTRNVVDFDGLGLNLVNPWSVDG
jgi:tRNA(fMet)-specific endonuclease VapC